MHYLGRGESTHMHHTYVHILRDRARGKVGRNLNFNLRRGRRSKLHRHGGCTPSTCIANPSTSIRELSRLSRARSTVPFRGELCTAQITIVDLTRDGISANGVICFLQNWKTSTLLLSSSGALIAFIVHPQSRNTRQVKIYYV